MNKSDELIKNLFVIQYYFSEIQAYCGNKPKAFVADEYLYEWQILQPNFKIIRGLLFIRNEYCYDNIIGYNYIGESCED